MYAYKLRDPHQTNIDENKGIKTKLRIYDLPIKTKAIIMELLRQCEACTNQFIPIH